MPANLTPMYYKAERDYRRAQTAREQLECLQQMLQLMPKHKGTDKLQGHIKSRLSEVRKTLTEERNASNTGQRFRIPRQGAGRIVIIGGPNCGKSRMLKELTRAEPEVAPFPFTTREPMTAMLDYEGVQIQLVDTPPVTIGHLPPWLLNLVRTADGVLIAFNGASDDAPEQTQELIDEFAARKTQFAETNGFAEDSFAIVNISAQLVVTHASDPNSAERRQVLQEANPALSKVVTVNLEHRHDVEALKKHCFDLLKIIRVFTKTPGQAADLGIPLTIPIDGTVEDLALQIHADLAKNLRHARLWGKGSHEGQVIGRDYVLRDGDIVELH